MFGRVIFSQHTGDAGAVGGGREEAVAATLPFGVGSREAGSGRRWDCGRRRRSGCRAEADSREGGGGGRGGGVVNPLHPSLPPPTAPLPLAPTANENQTRKSKKKEIKKKRIRKRKEKMETQWKKQKRDYDKRMKSWEKEKT